LSQKKEPREYRKTLIQYILNIPLRNDMICDYNNLLLSREVGNEEGAREALEELDED